MSSSSDYWFPAKRLGWGWGPPCRWQGWVVLAMLAGAIAADFAVFPPATSAGAFIAVMAASNLVFVLVCYLKGEPPRWRWGDRS